MIIVEGVVGIGSSELPLNSCNARLIIIIAIKQTNRPIFQLLKKSKKSGLKGVRSRWICYQADGNVIFSV